MGQKIVISKPGFNAGTTTNPDNLIFSSDYNTLKYYTSGTGSLTINGNGTVQSTIGTVTHNLGYIPFFIGFTSGISGTSGFNIMPLREDTIAVKRFVSGYADSTKLYIIFTSDTSGTLTYYYSYKIYKNNTGL